MIIEESIYPYFPEAESLPFYLTGIGGSEYQGHISRPGGYKWHQLLICCDGCGTLNTGSSTAKLASGSCFFLPKNTAHEYFPLQDKWNVLWLTFDGVGCDEVLNRLGLSRPVVIKSTSAAMQGIFEKMLISQKEDILYCGYTCSGLVYDMLIEFHRLMNDNVSGTRSRKLSTILPALRFIHDHFDEDIPLSTLASLAGVTPQHLCRLFREALSMRPTDYLLNRRLDEAKRLIRETDMRISIIAQRCGFNDAGYFSTVFRRHEGCSPAAFRREYK